MAIALKASFSGICAQQEIAASMNVIISAASGAMTTFYDADILKIGDDQYIPIIYYV